MEDRAEVAVVHEPLGEEVMAVALDELLEQVPAVVVLDRLQHGEPDVAAVAQPAGQEGLDGLVEALDQLPLGATAAGLLARRLFSPTLRRDDDALDDPFAADGEETVELGEGPGPTGWPCSISWMATISL